MRREHKDDAEWEAFLLEQGLNPQSFKAELRAQHTVAALLDPGVAELSRLGAGGARGVRREPDGLRARRGARSRPPSKRCAPASRPALRQSKLGEIQAALLTRLRERAKIEIFL